MLQFTAEFICPVTKTVRDSFTFGAYTVRDAETIVRGLVQYRSPTVAARIYCGSKYLHTMHRANVKGGAR
jgi:hypothetical protein